MASLNHPNIGSIYGLEEAEECSAASESTVPRSCRCRSPAALNHPACRSVALLRGSKTDPQRPLPTDPLTTDSVRRRPTKLSHLIEDVGYMSFPNGLST